MKVFLLLFLLFYSLIFAEDIKDKDKLFTTICTEDVSLGIFFVDGKEWSPKGLKPEQYIVQKIKKGNITVSGKCSFTDLEYKLEHGDRTLTKGCYNIREMDSQFYASSSKVCFESWKKNEQGKILEGVDCGNFKFMPNKYFHQSQIYGVMDNNGVRDLEDMYKRTPRLSTGECKVISQ